MVSTSSAAAQANENEKRRKQTMEKVKANHLSRQLQMRLQYARLKVEHGWQKQNLNEVENLYFHNSHLRGAKPFPAPALATTQRQHSSFMAPQANVMQSSSLSFKLTSSSLGRNGLNLNQTPPNDQNIKALEHSETTPAIQLQVVQDTSFPINSNPSSKSNPPNEPSDVAADSQPTRSSVVSTFPHPVASNVPTEDINLNQGDTLVPTISLSPQSQDTESPMDVSVPSSSNPNHYPPIKPPRPRAPKVINNPKTTPSLTTRELYNFGSTSTLTYDSFWSSHSGSTTPRPGPLRSPAIADLPPIVQIPVDLTSGVQEPSRSSVYSPSPNSQQPQ